VTYKLNCSGEFTRARFGHSDVFEKMTDEWPTFLAPGDKLVPIIAFGRGFLVELPPKRSWLSQETSEILPWCDERMVHFAKVGWVLECFRIP
jgi:hypothetical protein